MTPPLELKPNLSQAQARDLLTETRAVMATLLAAHRAATKLHLSDNLSDARTVYTLECLSCAQSAIASLELELRPKAGSGTLDFSQVKDKPAAPGAPSGPTGWKPPRIR